MTHLALSSRLSACYVRYAAPILRTPALSAALSRPYRQEKRLVAASFLQDRTKPAVGSLIFGAIGKRCEYSDRGYP
jgi:hypothetical protein